ncbi:MAG: hypothetical protein ACKO4O_05845, partial [Candidatus Limnocylindrus sp.]
GEGGEEKERGRGEEGEREREREGKEEKREEEEGKDMRFRGRKASLEITTIGVELWVGPPIPPDPSGVLLAPASDLRRP